MTAAAEVLFADTVEEAASLIAARGAVPLAGGTWIMRGPARGETPADAYVALSGIDALHELSVDADALTIGACVTHARIASALADAPAYAGLRDAAGRSATPAVRELATIGGGLGAAGFPASDLVPALLALDASVIVGDEGVAVALGDYLAQRTGLVRAVRVADAPVASAHRRLPLRRGGGDYPVAIVSVARASDGELRIAVGSVGDVACRWTSLEQTLDGGDGADAVRELAGGLTAELAARDGVEAPAWYREQVVCELAARAIEDLG